MLEAYLVVPALGLVYLLGAPRARRARLAHLALAGVVLLAVSLAWPLAVDLTPASLRPWVDSTQDNSAISLAVGYNGLERLLGQNRSLGQFLSGLGPRLSSAAAETTDGGGFGGGGMFNNGAAGPLRLFDQQLGGQASWLLPLSLVGAVLAGWQAFTDRARSRRGQAGIVWGTWLLAAGGFFSVANFFHSYYLVTLGPPIAALAGLGGWYGWQAFRAGGRLAWLLPAMLVGTALVQASLLSSYPGWSTWLSPLVVGGAALGAVVLGVVLVRERLGRPRALGVRLGQMGAGVALAALLVAPGVWSGYSALYDGGGGLPSAGPQVAQDGAGFGGAGGGPPAMARASSDSQTDANATTADDGAPAAADGSRLPSDDMPGGGPGGTASGGPGGTASAALVSYLEANQGSATYLVATTDSNTAASIILASDEPVMSLGGFTGSDPILTVDQFASRVESGQVRYVLVGGGGGGGPQSGGSSSILSWVKANGTLVSSSALGDASGSQTQLYDLSGVQAATA